MQIHKNFFVAGVLALGVGANLIGPTLAAQTASTSAVSPFARQHQLRVRFHRLWLRVAASHTGWERGFWLRGPTLAADYADRTSLVQFLRTELVPYLNSERSVVYPVADILLGRAQTLTAAAIADGHIIEGFVERLDAAALSPDTRGFQNEADALSVVLDHYFATDHRLIQEVVALGPRTDARRVSIAGR